MTLDADCTTDTTILIPDGFTLDGNDKTITAIDPANGRFDGSVIKNAGDEAHVTSLTITTDGLVNGCNTSSPDKRLRGIWFDRASGSIVDNKIVGINKGPSGCQEGNAIDIRNYPLDANIYTVEIAHNEISDYQKTGIVANGGIDVNIHHNRIGSSATQANLAANSLQLGYGAKGMVKHNLISGNEWLGDSHWVATAILIYDAGEVEVSQNAINGNSEIGIYIYGNGGKYFNNRLTDEGTDLSSHVGGTISYDIGIGNYGEGNIIENNKVKGFEIPYEGVIGGKNKSGQGKNKSELFF